jgi:hypothetical protein
MRNRRRLLLASAFALILVVGGIAWWLLHGPRVTDAAYDRIDIGMSLAEVEAIIGGPPGNYGGEQPQEYLPRQVLLGSPAIAAGMWTEVEQRGNVTSLGSDFFGAASPVSITQEFMPVQSWVPNVRRVLTAEEFKALKPPARMVLWTGPNYAIAVHLDAEDRVVNACLAKNFREPGMFERLLSRVGIR